MKPRWHEIISRAVECGTARGVRRAFKHSESPSEEAICASVEIAVMGEISEVVHFDDEDVWLEE